MNRGMGTKLEKFGQLLEKLGLTVVAVLAGAIAFFLSVVSMLHTTAVDKIDAGQGLYTIVYDIKEKLVAAGFLEIVLTGIHLGKYGSDLEGNVTLADACREVLQVKGLKIGVLTYTYGSNYYQDDFFFEPENAHITSCVVPRESKYFKACQNR